MKNLIFKALFLFMLVFFDQYAMAVDTKITKLTINTELRSSYVGVKLAAPVGTDPKNCSDGAVEHRLNQNNVFFDEYYSLLLSASLSDKSVSVSSVNIAAFVCEIEAVELLLQ